MSYDEGDVGDLVPLPDAIVRRLLGGGAAAPSVAPEQRALWAAMARKELILAAREELNLRRDQALFEATRAVPLFDVLPGRFDLVVVGGRGTGKTRTLRKMVESMRGTGLKLVLSSKCWPDWNLVENCVCMVDEAGVLMEGAERARDLPPELLRVLALARSKNVCLVLVAQYTHQVPPAILRHGVGLLVTGTPWLWRVQAREDMRDRLDVASDLLARREDPSAVCYVNPDGGGRLVVV